MNINEQELKDLIEGLEYEHRKGMEIPQNLMDALVLSLEHQRNNIRREIEKASPVFHSLPDGTEKDALYHALLGCESQNRSIAELLSKLNKHFRTYLSAEINLKGRDQ